MRRDFVEFPSQIFEHWIETPEMLRRYACHYRTGEPLPEALLERLARIGEPPLGRFDSWHTAGGRFPSRWPTHNSKR